MNTNDEKRAEFPTKYGQVQKVGPKTPILGLADGMTETTIQLRFAGYKDGLQQAAKAELDATSLRIGRQVREADKERHAKVLKSGDERQRMLTEAEKLHQADLRAAKSANDKRLAEIERHHKTHTETALKTFVRELEPMNAEMDAERTRITNELTEKVTAAKAEMDPAMETAKAARLASEAERKARATAAKEGAAALAEAAKTDDAALAGATDLELAAAAAVEAGAGA